MHLDARSDDAPGRKRRPKVMLTVHRAGHASLFAAALAFACTGSNLPAGSDLGDANDTGASTMPSSATSADASTSAATTSAEPDVDPTPDVLDAPFTPSQVCGACHPVHHAQWQMSMHAYGGSDPVMHAMRELAATDMSTSDIAGECLACHAPALSRLERLGLGDTPQAQAVRHDGLGCDVCHSINVHPPPVADIEFLDAVDPRGPKLARIEDPIATTAHDSRVEPGFGRAAFCAPCHQVNFDDGRPLENTFNEWSESDFGEDGVSCQLCHMPGSRGPAAVGGPERRVHDHRFIAMDYALEPFMGVDVQAQKDEILRLLQGSLSFFVKEVPEAVASGEPLEFVTRIGNAGAGHSIPSGTSFAREIWISVILRDAIGRELYASGQLDHDGDLDRDPDLVFFGSVLYDAAGEQTPFSWRAVAIDDSQVLPARAVREVPFSIDVPTDAVFPLALTATLRARPLSPGLLRTLGLERLLPIEIFDIWQHERSIEHAE